MQLLRARAALALDVERRPRSRCTPRWRPSRACARRWAALQPGPPAGRGGARGQLVEDCARLPRHGRLRPRSTRASAGDWRRRRSCTRTLLAQGPGQREHRHLAGEPLRGAAPLRRRHGTLARAARAVAAQRASCCKQLADVREYAGEPAEALALREQALRHRRRATCPCAARWSGRRRARRCCRTRPSTARRPSRAYEAEPGAGGQRGRLRAGRGGGAGVYPDGSHGQPHPHHPEGAGADRHAGHRRGERAAAARRCWRCAR